jgi:hypothetical protein
MPAAHDEPIYDTIGEDPNRSSGSKRSSMLAEEEFLTPPGSPLTKKSPDTLSTGSSGAEEDGLMREILREVTTRQDGQESIYSSLMRRKDKKHRRKPKSPEA